MLLSIKSKRMKMYRPMTITLLHVFQISFSCLMAVLS